MNAGEDEEDPFRAVRLILSLRQSGVTNTTLLNAMESTPRQKFVDPRFVDQAYEDVALPIDCGQTIARPITVADMIQALDIDENEGAGVLHVGTGTGYTAALLARMAKRVFTIERFRTLMEAAKDNLLSLNITNVELRLADGLKGWPEAAPFDRILLSGAVEDLPPLLVEQLKPGGIMVVPVGYDSEQRIVRVVKKPDGALDWSERGPSRFLPMMEGIAREL